MSNEKVLRITEAKRTVILEEERGVTTVAYTQERWLGKYDTDMVDSGYRKIRTTNLLKELYCL